jgi:hypothetical protein
VTSFQLLTALILLLLTNPLSSQFSHAQVETNGPLSIYFSALWFSSFSGGGTPPTESRAMTQNHRSVSESIQEENLLFSTYDLKAREKYIFPVENMSGQK